MHSLPSAPERSVRVRHSLPSAPERSVRVSHSLPSAPERSVRVMHSLPSAPERSVRVRHSLPSAPERSVRVMHSLPSKASGPDQIPNKILRELAIHLAPVLTSLFNQSLLSETLPSDWKTANVTPVFKKGNRSLASNYRPISLVCVACKLLEHCIVSHVMQHFDQNIIF